MLYGRDAEQAAIASLLDAARSSRGAALVVRGEPGIGKTALLEDAGEQAGDMHVLRARGVESESELPFAGLYQLIRPALHLLEYLPGPQAAALQGALGLTERSGDDRFLIAAASLTLLSELGDERPVLCLVDDAHWLDTPSADALLFVSRRLDAEAIAMLFAAREGESQRFEARELREVELRGLDTASAAALLDSRVETSLGEDVRDLLVDRARGNALALVELPGALSPAQLAGVEPLPETLPLTRDVEQLFLARVRRLPEPTQRLLLVLAADDAGALAPVLEAAGALGIPSDAIDAAERARLISVQGASVVFQHPLVRSSVYQSASSNERRTAHLALAEALSSDLEPDQWAWHRAAAAPGPDEAIAEALETVAMAARLRSAHGAAASAFERSADLSTDADSKAARLVAAADAEWHAGHPGRASALIERARPVVSDPLLQASLDHTSGDIQQRCGSLLDGGAILLEGAARAAPSDSRKALDMLFDAASCGMQAGDHTLVTEAARQAEALPRSEDDEQRFLADLLIGVGSLWLGTSTQEVALMQDVLARADAFEKPRLLAGAAMGAGMLGDEAREAALLRRSIALARNSGAVDALTLSLLATAVAGVLAGRFSVVREATEGLGLAREARLTGVASFHLAILSWFAAAKGEDDACGVHAEDAAKSVATTQNAFAGSIAEWALALLDLGRARLHEAIDRLTALGTAPRGYPVVVLASTPDLVEACVRAGRREESRTAFAAFEGFAQAGAPSWALALAARCRALLADDEHLDEDFAEALRLHAEGNRPFDRARTELLFGEHLRRQRRRVESRKHLGAALDGFERLGAEPWAERARTELRASGATARKRDPSTVGQLTPQELQIASFVAEGLSNKEVAAQLFLSPRTIDYHLRNVFAKLDITSRTQLARLALDEAGSVQMSVSA